jgi:hypothetical protein
VVLADNISFLGYTNREGKTRECEHCGTGSLGVVPKFREQREMTWCIVSAILSRRFYTCKKWVSYKIISVSNTLRL